MTQSPNEARSIRDVLEELLWGEHDDERAALDKAAVDICSLIEREVVGTNEPTNKYRNIKRDGLHITDCKSQSHNWSRNTLRAEQRAKLKEVMGGE